MDETQFPILEHHTLAYIPRLRVNPSMFAVRFADDCATARCSAACCQGGVWADVAERDVIMQNVTRIQQSMEPEQEHDPAKWFDEETIGDIDYPSGKAVGTQVYNDKCVFLDRAGLCVLQKTETALKDPGLKLKPFFCKAFPITVENHMLNYDDYMEQDQPQCCSRVNPSGNRTVFDVCWWELEIVVGKEGVEELKTMAKNNIQ